MSRDKQRDHPAKANPKWLREMKNLCPFSWDKQLDRHPANLHAANMPANLFEMFGSARPSGLRKSSRCMGPPSTPRHANENRGHVKSTPAATNASTSSACSTDAFVALPLSEGPQQPAGAQDTPALSPSGTPTLGSPAASALGHADGKKAPELENTCANVPLSPIRADCRAQPKSAIDDARSDGQQHEAATPAALQLRSPQSDSEGAETVTPFALASATLAMPPPATFPTAKTPACCAMADASPAPSPVLLPPHDEAVCSDDAAPAETAAVLERARTVHGSSIDQRVDTTTTSTASALEPLRAEGGPISVAAEPPGVDGRGVCADAANASLPDVHGSVVGAGAALPVVQAPHPEAVSAEALVSPGPAPAAPAPRRQHRGAGGLPPLYPDAAAVKKAAAAARASRSAAIRARAELKSYSSAILEAQACDVTPGLAPDGAKTSYADGVHGRRARASAPAPHTAARSEALPLFKPPSNGAPPSCGVDAPKLPLFKPSFQLGLEPAPLAVQAGPCVTADGKVAVRLAAAGGAAAGSSSCAASRADEGRGRAALACKKRPPPKVAYARLSDAEMPFKKRMLFKRK